jgi:hypothetical protein
MIGFRQSGGRPARRGVRAAAGSWDSLVAAVMPAVEAALRRVDEGARDAAERAGQLRAQATERSRDAADALRGRRRSPRWQWVAAALAGAAVVGAVGALTARRALTDAMRRRKGDASDEVANPTDPGLTTGDGAVDGQAAAGLPPHVSTQAGPADG